MAALNTALANITYAPDSGFDATDYLVVSINDLAFYSQSANTSVTIAVITQLPTITVPGAQSVNAGNSLNLNGAIAVTDVNAGANPDTLTLSVSHGTLIVGGTNAPTVTFTGTAADFNTILGSLTYVPNDDYSGADTLSVSLQDGNYRDMSASGSVAISVAAQLPTIAAPAWTLSTPGETTLAFTGSSTISVADSNATYYGDAEQVTVSASHGTVDLDTAGLSVQSGASGTGTVTVSGTVDALNSALAGLTYTPANGFDATDYLTVSITDPYSEGAGTSATIAVITQLPTVTVPGAQGVNAGTALDLSATISVTDINATVNPDTLILSVSHGTLIVGGTTAASITLTGTPAALNTALNDVTYIPNDGYSGADSLSLSLQNGDYTDMSASGSVAISVAAQLPTIAAPAWTLSTPGETTLAFTGSSTISVADSNATYYGDAEQVTVSASHGTVDLDTAGLSVQSGASGTGTVTVSGTVDALNSALAGLTYTPANGFDATDYLTVSITDPYSEGAGTSATIAVITQLPTVTVPGAQGVNAGTALDLSATISVTDINATVNPDTLILSVSHGTLIVGGTTAASITLTGTLWPFPKWLHELGVNKVE